MKEWRYLVFLVKYHLNRWIREKKQGGVFYIGGSDVFPPPLKPEEVESTPRTTPWAGAAGRRGGCDGKICSD